MITADNTYSPSDSVYKNRISRINFPYLSKSQCSAAYPGHVILDQHLCLDDYEKIGTLSSYESNCFRDTGGPIMLGHVQIVSLKIFSFMTDFLFKCMMQGLRLRTIGHRRSCVDQTPGIHLRVSYYHDFIKSAIESLKNL